MINPNSFFKNQFETLLTQTFNKIENGVPKVPGKYLVEVDTSYPSNNDGNDWVIDSYITQVTLNDDSIEHLNQEPGKELEIDGFLGEEVSLDCIISWLYIPKDFEFRTLQELTPEESCQGMFS